MRKKETEGNSRFSRATSSVRRDAESPYVEDRVAAFRTLDVLSTTSGPIVVAAVFCLVFLVMGAAFSFSTFASELGRDLKAGSGSISFIFGCAMALLYGGGLFSGALADRIGTHRVAGAGALLAGISLATAGAVTRVWQADAALGLGFGLGLAICYTPAVAAVQPWFDRNRGVASGIALSGTGLGTLFMPLLARWLIDDEGWRAAFIIMGLGVGCFGFVASNWIRVPPGVPTASRRRWSRGSLRKLAREPSFRRLYVAGFLSSLVLLVPIIHMAPHAIRAGVAPRDAAWLISILGFGSLAGRLMLGHAADRLGRQRTLGILHVALGTMFLAWTIKEGFVALAFFAFAYGVCYGATIALRPAVIADHFGGPNLAAITGLHYTSSVLGPLIGPAAFGYSVDFWNSDLIASCVAAACLGRCRLFLCCETASNWTTPRGNLPAAAAPRNVEGSYQLPAFGTADRVILVESSMRAMRRLISVMGTAQVAVGTAVGIVPQALLVIGNPQLQHVTSIWSAHRRTTVAAFNLAVRVAQLFGVSP